MSVREQHFTSSFAWCVAIAQRIDAGAWLAYSTGRQPVLAFSGGKTPVTYLPAVRRLAHVPWHTVRLALVDDRGVPLLDRQSNEGLLRRYLAPCSGRQPRPSIVPLCRGPEGGPEKRRRNAAIEAIRPLDVAVLGMGTDGHIGSLFPNRPDLWYRQEPTVRFRFHGDRFDRISLTMDVLKEARRIVVAFRGEDKLALWHVIRDRGAESGSPLAELLRARRATSNPKIDIIILNQPTR